MAGKFSGLNYADVDWPIFNNGSLFKPIGLRVITITDDCTTFFGFDISFSSLSNEGGCVV